MFIKTSELKDWNDLQEKVRLLFEELGYEATTNQVISLANGGKAEVDVCATRGKSALAQRILIECKYWNQSVPRAIVQSLKMDVQEAGANFGLLIAKTGFQSGAYEGVGLTTVKLYTFEELQEVFAEEWYAENIRPLDEKYQQLAMQYRAFEFGTPERETSEKLAFNQILRDKRAKLEFQTLFPLSIYKDYRPDSALLRWSEIVKHVIPIGDGTNPYVTVAFHDARTFAQVMHGLFNQALDAWRQYYANWEEEFLKLNDDDKKAVVLS